MLLINPVGCYGASSRRSRRGPPTTRRDPQSQVQGEDAPGHGGAGENVGPRARVLSENLPQAGVLPQPVRASDGAGWVLGKLLGADQDQVQ
ncbi:hypothetical protein FKM82_024308 [Ascaphus truei]